MTQPGAPEPGHAPAQQPITESFSAFDAAISPSVHTDPAATTTSAFQTPAPFTAQQLEAFGVAFVDGILADVLLALTGVLGPGLSAALGLTQFAQQLQTDAANALAEAEGATTTANNANNNANTALANFTTLFTDLGVTNAAQLAALFVTLQNDQTAASTALATLWQSWGTALTAFISTGNFTTLITALESAWNTYITTVTTLTSGEFATIQQIFAAFGIDVSTGQTQLSNVQSATGSANLNTDITNLLTSLFGSNVVNAITQTEQDIINFITNGISGGSAPTSANSAAAPLGSVFGPSGIPHTTVAIPPSPGGGSITFDAHAAATPFTGSPQNFVNLTWDQTCDSTANYLVVRVAYYATESVTLTVSYDGQTMQSLLLFPAPDNVTTVGIFGLPNPVTGSAQQVSVELFCPFGDSIRIVAAESDSYIGVGSVGSAVAGDGTNSSPSLTVPSATGDYIVQAFVASATSEGNPTLSGYNQTLQYSSGALDGSFGVFMDVIAGDAVGASSVSFSASSINTLNDNWVAGAVNLIALPSTTLGSTFKAANTSTAVVSSSSGNNTFPNGFFNDTITTTADIGALTASNTVTVQEAGTYQITISVLLANTLSDVLLGLNLLRGINGATPTLVERGHTSFIDNGGLVNGYTVATSFMLYCNAGDVLQPGYFYSGTTGNAFVGDTTGASTYFKVGLMNRSLF